MVLLVLYLVFVRGFVVFEFVDFGFELVDLCSVTLDFLLKVVNLVLFFLFQNVALVEISVSLLLELTIFRFPFGFNFANLVFKIEDGCLF